MKRLSSAETNPLEVLRALVAQYPTQRAAAKALAVSQPFLHDLLNGRRTFSDKMLGKLGLRRAVVKGAAA